MNPGTTDTPQPPLAYDTEVVEPSLVANLVTLRARSGWRFVTMVPYDLPSTVVGGSVVTYLVLFRRPGSC